MSVKLIRLLSITKREISYHASVDTALMRIAQERMQGAECSYYVAYEVLRKADDKKSEKLGAKVLDLTISSKTSRIDFNQK